ncbi:unnamed protein product [Discula destructiva]
MWSRTLIRETFAHEILLRLDATAGRHAAVERVESFVRGQLKVAHDTCSIGSSKIDPPSTVRAGVRMAADPVGQDIAFYLPDARQSCLFQSKIKRVKHRWTESAQDFAKSIQ